MTEFERLCRALCEADGFNPDDLVYEFPLTAGVAGMALVPEMSPVASWTRYSVYVQAILTLLSQDFPQYGTDFEQLMDSVVHDNAPAPLDEYQPPKPDRYSEYGLVRSSPRAGLIPR